MHHTQKNVPDVFDLCLRASAAERGCYTIVKFCNAGRRMAKKLKNEPGLLKEALRVIMDDAVRRGVVEFEATDSHNLKIEYAYRLLVHDKKIIPLPKGQMTLPNMKHRLARWILHELPADHALRR